MKEVGHLTCSWLQSSGLQVHGQENKPINIKTEIVRNHPYRYIYLNIFLLEFKDLRATLHATERAHV